MGCVKFWSGVMFAKFRTKGRGCTVKGAEIREKIVALVCLTTIAIVAMVKSSDPENVVINVVVGICAFISGGVVANKKHGARDDGDKS